jgi:hypothetical protein
MQLPSGLPFVKSSPIDGLRSLVERFRAEKKWSDVTAGRAKDDLQTYYSREI